MRVFCDMTRSCGGITGGWTRVAELNISKSNHHCPSGLRERNESNVVACVRDLGDSEPGCSSVSFAAHNIRYSSVCGRIIAYQLGRPDAFANPDISMFVDGLVLTIYRLFMSMELVSLMVILGNIYGHSLQLQQKMVEVLYPVVPV